MKFDVIGDYGKAGPNELAVSNLVKSWNPEFVITLGDDNCELGHQDTIDMNIGQYTTSLFILILVLTDRAIQ